MSLKVYSDLSALPNGISPEEILSPFLKKYSYTNASFSAYYQQYSSIFELSVDINESDIVVLPANWEPVIRFNKALDGVLQLVQTARSACKPTVSFFGGDCSHIDIPITTDLIFRNSLYSFSRQKSDFAFPAWSEDIAKAYLGGQVKIREKRSKPVVGFCGAVNRSKLRSYAKYYSSTILNQAKKLLWSRPDIPPFNTGHILRAKALNLLSKHPAIEDNFIQRDNSVFFHVPGEALKQKLKAEFVGNMLDSDYILCCRGSGNYSFRFYETLSCGRIPVFINTDCVLPCDFMVDWKRYCVWVEESELAHLPEKVLEFHEQISPKEFVDLQYECRKIWERYIAPEGFYRNLHYHLSNIFESSGILGMEI